MFNPTRGVAFWSLSRVGFFVRIKSLSSEKSSIYKCSFCSDRLTQQPLLGWRCALLLLPMRKFRCPHCFDISSKPVQWIGRWLPGARLASLDRVSRKVRHANRAATKTSDRMNHGVLRALSSFGKRVTRLEQTFSATARKLLWFLSPRVWTKRSRPKSSRRRRGEQSDQ